MTVLPGQSVPGLERLMDHAARRMQRNGLRAQGRVILDRVTEEETLALSGLLGSRWRSVQPGARASVDLAMVDAALRDGPRPRSLAAVVAAARGAPLVDLRAQRATTDRARERAWAELHTHPALSRHPALSGWLDRERTSGAAARTARPEPPFALLAATLGVARALPADPPRSLARFAAARCGGDPHALDRGRPLDALLRRALAWLEAAQAAGPETEADRATVTTDERPSTSAREDAEARRARYDRWGLGCDELSSTVLCLGLRPEGEAPLAVALSDAARRGEPRVVTLRELRAVTTLACGPVAFCCENPDVVAAAADHLGPGCPPLICTAGWPSIAGIRLLRALVAGGAVIRHHGDMDPEGLAILDRALALTGGDVWRMECEAYRAAADAGAPLDGVSALDGVRHPCLQPLAAEIAHRGRAVREEQVLVDLLADLRRTARPG